MLHLPPPTNFAEGQRKAFGIAAGMAGLAFGIAVLIGASIVVFGDWGKELLPIQLYILGGCILIGSVGSLAVTIGYLVGGPVGRFDVEASKDSFKISAADDASAPSATATVEVKATAAPPAGDGE